MNNLDKGIILLASLSLAVFNLSAQGLDAWDDAWLNPPLSASPGCYYYWDTGNISKSGITKDLEAMKAIGIDEPFVANVVGKRAEPGPVKVFSEDWWDCMVHAANEAKRLGMHIGYFNCPGWSQSGGPWVKPTETMRYLVSRETRVNGGRKVDLNVKELFDSLSRNNLQLVSVQAFPVPLYDDFRIADLHPKVQAEGLEQPDKLFDGDMSTVASSEDKASSITLSLPKADTFRSLQIYPADRTMKGYLVMEAEDGKGGWNEVCRMAIDRDKLDAAVGPMIEGALTANFQDVTASKFRFIFHTDNGIKLREIALNKAARLAYSTEKQLGKLWPYPEVTATCYNWPVTVQPGQPFLTVPLDQVKDLTSMVDGQGRLQWRSPKGKWMILVTAMSPTNVFNSPCTPEASGYEIDKMNKKIAEAHVDSFIGKLMARIPDESKDAVRHVVADSYEKGAQNWTDGMEKDFQARYGYDPMPYLPVLTGRIVGDAEHSERFLWDLRRFIADRIATEYIGGLRDRSHHYGLKLWMENYGHWGYPGEFLNYGGESDEVSGEYWITKPQRGEVEVRCASSAAHIYGKQRVSAESFTDSGTTFNTQPDKLKARGDWAMCQGINHYVLHVYLHQPDDRKPGITAWFGTDFNRNNTWFSRGKSWIDYIRRSCSMLQQGHSVADVAYFIGENTPKMTGEQNPSMPEGYDFDFINAEVLMRATVGKNHRIQLPSGANYAVLVLPSDKTMRPAVAEKIAELMKQGAKVVGKAPEASPSLEDYPHCDSLVAHYAKTLSTSLLSPLIPLDETLHSLGWIEDCKTPEGFLYTHRQDGDKHIYFVSNQNGKEMDVEVAFRVEGMQPELWDAVSGKRSEASHYKEAKGSTIVPLHFESNGSWFIIFRNKKSDTLTIRNNAGRAATVQPESSILLTIDQPWRVIFKPSYAPAFESEFKRLSDWSTSENPDIRYYSGMAVYENTFTYKPEEKEQAQDICLDLGSVKGMATIRINDVELPTLWTAPYRQSVTPYLKDGENRIEIEVVNCWWNRLAGDAKPGSKPVTWTTNKIVNENSELMPSGLLGPVSLVSCFSATSAGTADYVITDYGVIQDSTVLQTKVIQNIIDSVEARGGGRIIVPRGTYLTGALFFKPGTKLKLQEGAVLKGSDNIEDYPLLPSRMEGKNIYYYAALINAYYVKGFSIEGPGTINGNGLNFWKRFWATREAAVKANKPWTNLEVHRPRLVFVWGSDSVTFKGAKFINSGYWTTHFYQCNDLLIEDCEMRAPREPVRAPSTDAIDLDVCRNVVIRGCYISTDDDGVCIKGGKGPLAHKGDENGVVENVLVENCTFGPSLHGTLTMGSEAIHAKNITLRNCKLNNGCALLRLKMRPDTYQIYENITIENVTGTCGSVIDMKYWSQFFSLEGTDEHPYGIVRDIKLSNIDVDCDNFIYMKGNPDDKVSKVTLENVTARTHSTDTIVNAYKQATKMKNVILNGKHLK